MNIGYDRIAPSPSYPIGTTKLDYLGFEWGDQHNIIKDFKSELKKSLREAQRGRCAYCRRTLYDDISTHMEHFVEKRQYVSYTFEILNISLSCGTCNTQKNAYHSSFNSMLKKRAERHKKAPITRCPTLSREIASGNPFPNTADQYRWVHPHFDLYSENITIDKGWIFVGSSIKGARTISGLKLNALAAIEKRALDERLSMRGGLLSTLVCALSEMSHHRADEIAGVVVKVLRRRRASVLR
ncbi:TIGR02646 family protein [Pseudomonas congelans]|uniref:TIGR02646 family protein n=1 Tax=Pseudomonas congelans TaxID=200452 RepID=A0A0N8R2F5_9PSED|nr:HNH endonuclease [Pseudomonas congelans]KPW86646.1 Uncharacterized protein ALO92_00580 [Pseudomonas congelans]SDO48776.1 TIGR02646 family protein [Pseudomonas congelans]